MVGPPPASRHRAGILAQTPRLERTRVDDKTELRQRMRKLRREHVQALPDSIRALIFSRPPSPVVEMIPDTTSIGLYHPHPHEAPTLSYAKFFHERGHSLALPYFPGRDAAMEFRRWSDPYDEDVLEPGPFGVAQPGPAAAVREPDVVFVPLVAFTERCERLGQGGGHYDRWLGSHRDAIRIGLAWDSQLVDTLPVERHDIHLHAVITSTRLYWGPHDA